MGDGCVLIARQAGNYRCMQDEETVGSIRLMLPSDQYVREPQGDRRYAHWSWDHFPEQSYHLCSDTGTIIDKFFLCDGDQHCTGNGEDEEGCFLPCGEPTVLEHSLLSQASELYPHGASVTYSCDRGFAFRETFDGIQRTCSHGRWSGRPPICQRNAGFGREATVEGLVMSGLGPELAVDGRTDTWTMLSPFTPIQSMTVKLETNVSVESVLVWMSNEEFEVSLQGPDRDTVCTCRKNETDSSEPTRLFRCHCPGSAGEPTGVIVRSTTDSSVPFSVAEIAVLGAPISVDDCTGLDRPIHGRFEHIGDSTVTLICEAGYRASCSDVLPCDEAAELECRPVSCSPPPVIPNTVSSNNGTQWSAVTQYTCATGCQLFPTDQRTEAVCGDDGLWSISYISCLPDTDVRVVTLRLGEQHERNVAELRTELRTELHTELRTELHTEFRTELDKLRSQLTQMRRHFRLLEDMLEITFDDEEPETPSAKVDEEPGEPRAKVEGEIEAEAETEAAVEKIEEGGEEQHALGETELVDEETQTGTENDRWRAVLHGDASEH